MNTVQEVFETLGEAEVKRRMRNVTAQLRRRRTKQSPLHQYTCQGGPWHGEQLGIRNTRTADLRIGDHRGYYEVPENPGRYERLQGNACEWRTL